MYKIGDKVLVGPTYVSSGNKNDKAGSIVTIKKISAAVDKYGPSYFFEEIENSMYEGSFTSYNGGPNMFKTVANDMKGFITEHKSVLYWMAVMLLADHVFFGGAFREKLHGLMNKMLGKVEAQIDGAKPVALVPDKKA